MFGFLMHKSRIREITGFIILMFSMALIVDRLSEHITNFPFCLFAYSAASFIAVASAENIEQCSLKTPRVIVVPLLWTSENEVLVAILDPSSFYSLIQFRFLRTFVCKLLR